MIRDATAEDYKLIFEDHPAGEIVLEDLLRRFGGQIFVRGGLEGDRETCYRAGKRDVVEHIFKMINRANGVDDAQENETPADGAGK